MQLGWSEAKYDVNPYYTSVYELCTEQEIYNDEILNKIPNVWCNQKIVYGPVWPLICKILTSISFGNLSIALIIFKIFNLIIHLLNCELINKISHKKIFTLIYALNPLILFESLTNVHNDALLVFFILLALYFVLRKKKIVLSVIALSIATAIKYVAILFVPFIVIYYYRKEKISKRFLNAIWLAIIFILVLVGIYILYTRDFQVLQGISTQQGKYANSLPLIIYLLIDSKVAVTFSKTCTIIFMILYITEVIICLFTKNIKLKKSLRVLYTSILILLFFVITNFQIWYIMWLFPIMIWQNKRNIYSIINLSISSELAITVFFIFGESYVYGKFLWTSMIVLCILFNLLSKKKILKLEI